MVDVIEYTKNTWTTEAPTVVVQQIGEGKRLPTEALGLSNNVKYRAQVVQAGGVDRILEFLLKTDKTFNEVKKEGDLPCPSIWLNVLNNFCQDGFLQPQSLARETKYKIAVNLGPIFQDMSNFERRELFGSKDYWIKCLMFFTNMLSGLLTSEYQRLGDFMLKQASLKKFLVRVLFLEIAEPQVKSDIVDFGHRDTRSPKPDVIGMCQSFCAFAIKSLTMKRGKLTLEEFGATPVRPEHEMTLKTGILKLLESSDRRGWYQGGYASMLNVFLQLFDHYGRLSEPFGVEPDSSASANLTSICTKYLAKYSLLARDRHFFENMVTGIVVLGASMMTPVIKERQAPIDYCVAKAIDNDLIDYCLDCCDTYEGRITKALEGLLRGPVASCGMLEDTNKALKAKEIEIRARLERVKDRAPYLFQPAVIIEKMLDSNLGKFSPKELACEFCFEKTTEETMKKCPFCKSIIYCSRDCLSLNWMLHQEDCKIKRKTPLAKTKEQLFLDGKTIFTQQLTKILVQASLKGVSILDVIVVVDMCEATPLLKTYTLEQFSEFCIQNEEGIAQSKNIFEKNKPDGALTVSFAGFTPDGLNTSLITFPPSTAPLLPSVGSAPDFEKWSASQKAAAQVFFSRRQGTGAGIGIEQIRSNKQLWQATLLQTMKP